LRGLRLRIFLTTGAVLVLAVAAIAILSARVSRLEFRRLEKVRTLGKEADLEPVARQLEALHAASGGWSGAGRLLSGGPRGGELVLADETGRIIAVSAGLRDYSATLSPDGGLTLVRGSGVRALLRIHGPRRPLFSPQGKPIGAVLSAHLPGEDASREETEFVGGVHRWLIPGVLLCAALALLAMAALSRRIFGPVEALTRAARRMEGGDLSQRVAIRSPDEIGELAHAFNSLAGALERGEILRRGMVSDVAHELRTPLTNIRCQIESLQDGLVTTDRAALDSLHEETMLLSRLVEDLQELSLAEAGGIRLDLTRVSVDDAVRSAAGAIAPRAREANVRLVIEPGKAPEARADPNRVAQVLRILLDNAVAHTPSGGEIRVRTLATEGGVRVEVSDTGAGIPREHLPHIFERFYRADPSRARETGGAGLGLAIARQLAQAQGGSISVESDPGRGTSFTVTLPRASPLP